MAPIRLLIADDHRLFRRGLVSLFKARKDFVVLGEAENGAQAVELARQVKPDVILLDVRMPVINGLEALVKIKQERPEAKVVMLTASDEDSDIAAALKGGASGYMLKTSEPDDLFKRLKDVMNSQTGWTGDVSGR